MKSKVTWVAAVTMLLTVWSHLLPAPAGGVRAQVAGGRHSAWVFCVDTSLSVDNEQFDRAKDALRRTIDATVTFGDRVWMIEMGAAPAAARPFALPVGSLRKSDRDRTGEAMQRIKLEIHAALDGLSRRALSTDVGEPIERGLMILREQPAAFARKLVVVSDFVSDDGARRMRLTAQTPTPGVTAQGVEVGLLVARPTADYLRRFRLSPAAHAETVAREWRQYFTQVGARSYAARLVDAQPAF